MIKEALRWRVVQSHWRTILGEAVAGIAVAVDGEPEVVL